MRAWRFLEPHVAGPVALEKWEWVMGIHRPEPTVAVRARLNQHGEHVTSQYGEPGVRCPACKRRGVVTSYRVYGGSELRHVCEACGTRWFYGTGVGARIRYRFNKYGNVEPWPER